jgi:predicted metal-dependent hydrolase
MLRTALNISIVFIIFVAILIFFKLSNSNVVYVRSQLDNRKYLVRDEKDKQRAANMLSKLWINMNKLKNHLIENKNKFPDYDQYIDQLERHMRHSKISESDGNTVYTSYTVNKGEEIVFCIRSRSLRRPNTIHNENLLMYVAIHELAHVACPERGHTPLFKKIFGFFIQESISIEIYTYEDYGRKPVEYCGMEVTDNII